MVGSPKPEVLSWKLVSYLGSHTHCCYAEIIPIGHFVLNSFQSEILRLSDFGFPSSCFCLQPSG